MRLTQRLEELLQRRAPGSAAVDLGSRVHAGGGAHPGARHRRQQRHLLAGRCGADAAAAVWRGRATGDAVGAHADVAKDRRLAAEHARLEPAKPVVRGHRLRPARHGRRAAADRARRLDRNGGASEHQRQLLRRPRGGSRLSAARSSPKTTARRRAWCCSAKPCGAADSAAIPRSSAVSCG